MRVCRHGHADISSWEWYKSHKQPWAGQSSRSMLESRTGVGSDHDESEKDEWTQQWQEQQRTNMHELSAWKHLICLLHPNLQFPNAVVLNAARTQKHANDRKRAQTQVRKRAQSSASEGKRALPRKTCKWQGWKQPGLGTPNQSLEHTHNHQGFPNMPFVKCLSGFAEVPYQVPPWSLPVAPRMPKIKPKEAYLVQAPKARFYPKVLIAKCLPGRAEGPYQGQPLSHRKCFKNVLGTRLEGTFVCKARLENAEIRPILPNTQQTRSAWHDCRMKSPARVFFASPTIRAPPPHKPCLTLQLQTWGRCIFCCPLRV